MAGVLSTFRGSFACLVSGGHAPHEELGSFARSASVRVNPFNVKSALGGAPQLRRQRTVSFSMGSCLCGKKSMVHGEAATSSSKFLLRGNSRGEAEPKESASQQHSWWQDSFRLLRSRRKSSAWNAEVGAGEEVYNKASRWKKLFWKLRAETRKMNCTKPQQGYHYDALSYAKNFDDGCWQQCEAHAQGIFSMRYSAPLVVKNEALNEEETGEDSWSFYGPKRDFWEELSWAKKKQSIWQRRKSTTSPALDLRMVRVWRPAQRVAQ